MVINQKIIIGTFAVILLIALVGCRPEQTISGEVQNKTASPGVQFSEGEVSHNSAPEVTAAPDAVVKQEENGSVTGPAKPEPAMPKPTEPALAETAPLEPPIVETIPSATVPLSTEPIHEHSYRKETVAPTCEIQGYSKYTCTCGSSYTEDYAAVLSHSWSEWKVVQASTFLSCGKEQRYCVGCGNTQVQDIAKLDASACHHSNIKEEVVSGACEDEGYTLHICTDCGYSYKDTYTEPPGHRFHVDESDEVKQPTLEADGYKRYSCIYCDHTETIVLPKLERIDTAKLEKYARQYARDVYGYDGNPDCLPENEAGYFPGITWTIRTMEEGYQSARDAVERQYNRDMAGGRVIYREDENGEVYYRRAINVHFEPTEDPNVFIIWIYYGGACNPGWQ